MCIKRFIKLFKARTLNSANPYGIIPTENDLKNAKKYERVVIFGVDGGGYHFKDYDLPNYQRIYKNGSVRYDSQSEFPTISAENWTAILHGVHYQTHLVTNTIASIKNFSNKKLPSVFRLYAERHPDATFASIVNWYPINKGIVEFDIPGMYKINAHEIYKGPDNTYAIDDTVAEEAVKFIKEHDPKIMFLHFDGPDHGSHSCGFGSDEFKKAMKHTDECIGKVYDAYVANGWGENTLFITVTDHGQITKPDGTGKHGGWSKGERETTLSVVGGLGNIIPGTHGKSGTVDVAAIAMYALGEKQPDNWVSSVPTDMFTTLKR